MNLRDLQYLVAVAETGHFRKAAEQCFVSQPTLSSQLKKLEQELGVLLIERGPRSAMLTPVGATIVAHARQLLLEAEAIRTTAKASGDPEAGEIRLGMIPTVAPYLLPGFLRRSRERFPRLDVIVYEEKTERLLESLRNGTLDGAVLAVPADTEGLEQTHLFDERFWLAAPRGHALAQQPYVTERDLRSDAVLLLEEGHCLRDQALAVCARARAQEHGELRATSLETLRRMVEAGYGITLVPALVVRAIARTETELAFVPFKDGGPSRTMALVYRKTAARKPLLALLAPLLSAAGSGEDEPQTASKPTRGRV